MINKKLTLNSGAEENEGYRRCSQINCSFYSQGGCKECSSCKTESFIIKKDCEKCFRCENVPGALRFGDENKIRQKQFEAWQKQKEEQDIVLKAIQENVPQIPNDANIIIIKRP